MPLLSNLFLSQAKLEHREYYVTLHGSCSDGITLSNVSTDMLASYAFHGNSTERQFKVVIPLTIRLFFFFFVKNLDYLSFKISDFNPLSLGGS